MSGNEERVRELIGQEAADWFVANRGTLSTKERQNFSAWLKTSPMHVEEYLAVSVISRDLRAACEGTEHSLEALVRRAHAEDAVPRESLWSRIVGGIREATTPRWLPAAAAMAAVAVVSFGLLSFWNSRSAVSPPPPEMVSVWHFATGHGEQRTQRLADNSVLHLNTDSAVTVRYSKSARLVSLTSGEAEFQVTHLPDRPFRVTAGPAQIVDVGTTFNVRLGSESTVVTVLEGLVAVAPAGLAQPAKFVQVRADQQITVDTANWPVAAVPVDAERSTAWLHRQISFEHEPLAKVVSEFNRYAAKPIEITSPGLRDLEISGVFSIDDTDAFIAFLRSLDGVHVEVSAKQIRVSQE
jgi:transmembrane sensor